MKNRNSYGTTEFTVFDIELRRNEGFSGVLKKLIANG